MVRLQVQAPKKQSHMISRISITLKLQQMKQNRAAGGRCTTQGLHSGLQNVFSPSAPVSYLMGGCRCMRWYRNIRPDIHKITMTDPFSDKLLKILMTRWGRSVILEVHLQSRHSFCTWYLDMARGMARRIQFIGARPSLPGKDAVYSKQTCYQRCFHASVSGQSSGLLWFCG